MQTLKCRGRNSVLPDQIMAQVCFQQFAPIRLNGPCFLNQTPLTARLSFTLIHLIAS